MKTRKDFGKFLQKRRERAGVTQAQLSDKLGYSSPQFVSNIERGKCAMPTKSIKRWAEIIEALPKDVFSKQLKVMAALSEQKFKGAR